jgi:hypothetical protein
VDTPQNHLPFNAIAKYDTDTPMTSRPASSEKLAGE